MHRQRAQPDQRIAREAAVAQVVEALAQEVVVVGQELDHHRLDRIFGAEAQRLVQRGVDGDAAGRGDLGAPGCPGDPGIQALDHAAEIVRVDGSDHPVAGGVLAAARGDDAGRAAVLHQHPGDVGAAHHLPAVGGDAVDQRPGQLARAAGGHAEAEHLQKAQEDEDAEAGGLLVGRAEVLAGDAGEVHLHFRMLEPLLEQVVDRHLHQPPQLAALAALVHQGVGGADRGRGAVEAAEQHRHVALGGLG